TVPYIPWSHPFIERLIGTIRRECLDQLLFWTATDLETKLMAFRDYYNRHRTHAGLKGETPIETMESKGANLKSYRWQPHCRGLYQTQTAEWALIRQGHFPDTGGEFACPTDCAMGGEFFLPPLSKVRAVCGSTACTDLRGGRRVI